MPKRPVGRSSLLLEGPCQPVSRAAFDQSRQSEDEVVEGDVSRLVLVQHVKQQVCVLL